MSAKKKSSQGVTMNNLSQVNPDDPQQQTSEQEGAGAKSTQEEKNSSRLSVSAMDADLVAELKGFTLFLAQVGGREGMRTMGDVIEAAVRGDGDLPTWRKRYNDGNPFHEAAMLPPGRK